MEFPDVHVYAGAVLIYAGKLIGPTEFGRVSDMDEEATLRTQSRQENLRVTIAETTLTDMSRRLLLVTPISGERVHVSNLSSTNFVIVESQDLLRPMQNRELDLPVVLTIFDRKIELSCASGGSESFQSLGPPMQHSGFATTDSSMSLFGSEPLSSILGSVDQEQLVDWLRAVTRVLQSAVSSVDYRQTAAKEMVDLVGLDYGRVLRHDKDGTWHVVTTHGREDLPVPENWSPISQLMEQLVRDKQTLWQAPVSEAALTESMLGVSIAIASPLLDQQGNVVGALYGERRHEAESNARVGLSKLEAMLVETLAQGIAAGNARVAQERVATEAQLRFEQFFTPELSRHLSTTPDLLICKDTEVSLLFCDIRRFSRISELLGPSHTMEWISDVMLHMTECAEEFGGVLVDYIGDELMIMWGAPSKQDDHANLAAQAALAMAKKVAEVDAHWFPKIGQHTQLGFGLNSGIARVGNVGFEKKFRYAPLGNAVNLASRVQGATKYLGVDVLVTEATHKQLTSSYVSRRLCSVRVVNIQEPVHLYQLCLDDTPEARSLCLQYEEALHAFDQRKLTQASHILSELLKTFPEDRPALLLLSRAVDQLVHADSDFDGVMELSGK